MAICISIRLLFIVLDLGKLFLASQSFHEGIDCMDVYFSVNLMLLKFFVGEEKSISSRDRFRDTAVSCDEGDDMSIIQGCVWEKK